MAGASYAGDPTILDSADLWRRIPSWHIVYDQNLQRLRPSSAAFEDHPNGSPHARGCPVGASLFAALAGPRRGGSRRPSWLTQVGQ